MRGYKLTAIGKTVKIKCNGQKKKLHFLMRSSNFNPWTDQHPQGWSIKVMLTSDHQEKMTLTKMCCPWAWANYFHPLLQAWSASLGGSSASLYMHGGEICCDFQFWSLYPVLAVLTHPLHEWSQDSNHMHHSSAQQEANSWKPTVKNQ